MSDKKLELNRRRVLAGIGVIGAASAGAGAGTMALFSDTESSSGNTVQAGTLDLKVAGQNPLTANEAFGPFAPGDSKSYNVPLKNVGTIQGVLDFRLSGTNSEGDNPESEPETQTDGDLGDHLMVTIEVGGSQKAYGTFNEVTGTYPDVATIAGGDSTNMKITMTLPEGTGNEVQGDVITADITFYLNQTAGQDPPLNVEETSGSWPSHESNFEVTTGQQGNADNIRTDGTNRADKSFTSGTGYDFTLVLDANGVGTFTVDGEDFDVDIDAFEGSQFAVMAKNYDSTFSVEISNLSSSEGPLPQTSVSSGTNGGKQSLVFSPVDTSDGIEVSGTLTFTGGTISEGNSSGLQLLV